MRHKRYHEWYDNPVLETDRALYYCPVGNWYLTLRRLGCLRHRTLRGLDEKLPTDLCFQTQPFSGALHSSKQRKQLRKRWWKNLRKAENITKKKDIANPTPASSHSKGKEKTGAKKISMFSKKAWTGCASSASSLRRS